MADPMRIRAQAQGEKTTVRADEPRDETGQRKDSAGKIVPAWFIQEVERAHNGKTVMTAPMGPGGEEPFPQRSSRARRPATRSRSAGRTTGRQPQRPKLS